jgi:hypothetical protein
MRTLNVAIIGTKFMGKAHSNAWLNAPRFFDMPATPVLKEELQHLRNLRQQERNHLRLGTYERITVFLER